MVIIRLVISKTPKYRVGLMLSICNGQHLYSPLSYTDQALISMCQLIRPDQGRNRDTDEQDTIKVYNANYPVALTNMLSTTMHR